MPEAMQISAPPSWSHAPIPARAGVGLKPEHYGDILEGRPDIGWFEVHPENYMGAGGAPHHYLTRVREAYPHLAAWRRPVDRLGAATLDKSHLARLRALIERYEPGSSRSISPGRRTTGAFLNDLLPLPYTEETLATVSSGMSTRCSRPRPAHAAREPVHLRRLFLERP